MDSDKKMKLYILAFLILVPMVFCSLLIPTAEGVGFDMDQFAVDQAGRVYVHTSSSREISVYQNGAFLYDYGQIGDMAEHMDSRARFIITEDDEFWMVARGIVYAMDLEGNLLRNAPQATHTAEIDGHDGVYRDSQGNVYEMKGAFLGRTRIVKNGTEVVYAISGLAFACKLMRIFSVVAIFPLIISFLHMMLKDKRDFGYWS